MDKGIGKGGAAGASALLVLALVLVVAVAFGAYVYLAEGGPKPAEPAEVPAETAAETAAGGRAGWVTDGRVLRADMDDPGMWLAHGRTHEEQRFSPLAGIHRGNVAGLGVAWLKDLGTYHPVEATPLVVDGVMYFTAPWNVAYAVDAATGAELWSFDPGVPGETARAACCGVISRGLAVYEGRVHLATLDGRLLALDAGTGSKLWEVDTVIDRSREYTITGAPRAAAGKVFIGNGGAEYGVRGYVTAYDAATGEQAWRFFTVPGDPSLGFESEAMAVAAETWSGGAWWEIGGGGTVWNAIVYDPDFDAVYLGVGNGSPWTRAIRSPGGGDNLYLASIVAVDAATGEYRWHYQTVPGDNWDYTAVQDMALADLAVDGVERKVLMQAPKNGFFYVIDRSDGTLLRAHPYATVTWATRVDMETGRPVENPDTAYADAPQWILPGPGGGHNWQAMSWDAGRGLMYLGAHDLPFLYAMPEEYRETGVYKRRPGAWNTALEFGRLNQMIEATENPPEGKGYLIAFDPLTGETRWRVEQPLGWNGGVLGTAGGLVFQGDAQGQVAAYDADTGELLWRHQTHTSILAPPITYAVDGEQHVAIMTGAGKAANPASATWKYGSHGRLIVFKLGGDAMLPVPPLRDLTIPELPPITASAEDIDRGDLLYNDHCRSCHGLGAKSPGAIPDLRLMTLDTHGAFQAIVLGGTKRDAGMASFADLLDAQDVERIRQYVITRAQRWREEQAAAAAL